MSKSTFPLFNRKQNLEIIQVDTENNVILVKGNVPGPKKSFVMIRTAVKRPGDKNEASDLITYVVEEEVTEEPVEETVEEAVETTEEVAEEVEGTEEAAEEETTEE